MESKQPSAVAFAARPEAIETFSGAQRRSPGIISDQAKLAVADSAALYIMTALGVFRPIAHHALLLSLMIVAALVRWCTAIHARFLKMRPLNHDPPIMRQLGATDAELGSMSSTSRKSLACALHIASPRLVVRLVRTQRTAQLYGGKCAL